MSERRCKWCNKLLPVDSSEKRLYCDRHCTYANYYYKGRKDLCYAGKVVACSYCGKLFVVKGNNNIYCGRACANQVYYYKDVGKTRAANNKYYNENLPRRRVSARKYYKQNKDKLRENSRNYYFNNRIYLLEQQKRNRHDNLTLYREKAWCHRKINMRNPPDECRRLLAIIHLVKLICANKLKQGDAQTIGILNKIKKGETHAAYEYAVRH